MELILVVLGVTLCLVGGYITNAIVVGFWSRVFEKRPVGPPITRNPDHPEHWRNEACGETADGTVVTFGDCEDDPNGDPFYYYPEHGSRLVRHGSSCGRRMLGRWTEEGAGLLGNID